MPPHMDSFCAFVDCKNVKKDNISMSHTKALIPILLNQNPERLGKAYVVNVSWLIKTVWKSIKVFLDKRTTDKIHFLGKKEMPVLSNFFDLNILPSEYGGNAEYKF